VLKVRQIEFSQDDIKQLSQESIHHSHPIVRRRMQALLLKSQGVMHKEIGIYLNLSQTTLRKYFDLYLSGGVEALKQLHYQGKTNQLLQHKEVIVEAMEANPPATLKQARAMIKEATGLERSLPQVREFLKKTNLSGAKSNNSRIEPR
jgi:transposase